LIIGIWDLFEICYLVLGISGSRKLTKPRIYTEIFYIFRNGFPAAINDMTEMIESHLGGHSGPPYINACRSAM